jgi:hypothetical protein
MERFVAGKDAIVDVRAAPQPPVNWQGLLGYLNFAEGKPDPRFQGQFHAAYLVAGETAPAGSAVVQCLADLLDEQLTALHQGSATAFREVGQARTVIQAALRDLPPLYRQHHRDLLAHQSNDALLTPFFLARSCEAVLAARAATGVSDPARLAAGALSRLNDFVGYRPVPILENRRAGEVYTRERFRPVPLYLRGVGVAAGHYEAIVLQALTILSATDPNLLDEGQFDLRLLDELALDPRAYDHNHPANRRPNHVFGEWDPHHLDNQGRHRRFVVRQTTLDALLSRVEISDPADRDGRIFEAGAVMAGTMLMAAALCGRGPNAYDSATTLSNLVPRIARLRDAFYDRLLRGLDGPRGVRLRSEAEATRQPFGGARQHLNQVLAQERALQLQERHLALLFAALGYPEVSRRRAAAIATASVRMAAEVRSHITTAGLLGERGDPAAAADLLAGAEDLLHRGIECGALADPWSMLGFQGLYPLFQSREDSIHDPRIDELLGLVGDLFAAYAQVLGEAAARGDDPLRERLTSALHGLAEWWDQFAGFEVGDLPRVHGGEAAAAAEHVATALARWRERKAGVAGPGPTSDLAFWRQHLEGFRTPAAFARVVAALLDRGDLAAAMGLLMAWLSQAPAVTLEEGESSFHSLARRWAEAVVRRPDTTERRSLLRRFFEALEANAEVYWYVPELSALGAPADDEADDVFGAAYEGVTFRDSAEDGTEGAVLGGARPGADFPLEHQADELQGRLQFLATSSELWRTVARQLPEDAESFRTWLTAARERRARLDELLDQLHRLSVPEPETGFEGAVEYDRRRAIKEQVIEEALAAAVATDQAIRTLRAKAGDADETADGWEELAVALERTIGLREPRPARAALRRLLPRLRREPLLYVPLSAGGHPRQILQARSAQAFLHGLMERLPRLGLLRETFTLVQTARAMEQASSPEGRKVTEFDRLFPVALQATVGAVIDVANDRAAGLSDRELQDALRRIADPYLVLWIEHSQTLRLSILETVQSAVDWELLRGFIERYGHELFTPSFLNLASLRSVLHRGVAAWLDELRRQEDPPEKFLDALDGQLPRPQAERLLETILQAVVENYEEYRDYNTTTTQSDYGENLFVLLDFLRLKSAYERDNWRMRPLVLVHEVLCRRGRPADAAGWQEGIVHYTRQHADRHLHELAQLEARHGLKLRTVRDRLGERFVAPLVIDRLCALLGPAWAAARRGAGEDDPAFVRLREEVDSLAATPAGVGLDVPPWLRRLERELIRLRREPEPVAPPPVRLTVDELRKQLERGWGGLVEE